MGARLPTPGRCAVPGCTASSSHAGDFARIVIHVRHETPREVLVCWECLHGRTAGLPAVAAPCVAALGALCAAASPVDESADAAASSEAA